MTMVVPIHAPMSDVDRAADNGTRAGPVCISRGIPVTVCRPVAIRAAPVAHRGRVIADHRATGRTPVDPVLIAIVDALRRWQVACACIPEAGITEAAAPAVLGIGRTSNRNTPSQRAGKRNLSNHDVLLMNGRAGLSLMRMVPMTMTRDIG